MALLVMIMARREKARRLTRLVVHEEHATEHGKPAASTKSLLLLVHGWPAASSNCQM